MDAVLRAAAADQRVFDDVVALGLADGRITARTLQAAVPSSERDFRRPTATWQPTVTSS
jgi:hypothetical protein